MEALTVDQLTVPLVARELGKVALPLYGRQWNPPKASKGSAPHVASRVPIWKGPRVCQVGEKETVGVNAVMGCCVTWGLGCVDG